ncbi:MAG: RNA polymerase subunit sigma, partial [candidate division Zixibacteria bacterium]|nr:RNA polymerase subunit sigma [candidate division Zixibacteria bacterium]
MSPAELGKKQRNFEDAVLTHSKSLYITAYNLTGDKARAEDLTQETYLKAYNSFASFRLGTNSRAWLSRIMMNTYINDYHKSKREVDWEGFESSIPIPAKENSFNEISFQLNERDLLKEWVDDEIRHAINRLP